VTARALLSLLFHAEKALDLVQAALDLGILARLDAGEVTLDELCEATGARPLRMYKLLDGLESLGFVSRRQDEDDILGARYSSLGALEDAARATLGPESIERDRDRYAWRALRGRIPEVVRGAPCDQRFEWPPRTKEQLEGFEASMSAGCAPIVESFRAATEHLFPRGRPLRWLDVGGGDGTLAAGVLGAAPHVTADVFNLPAAREVVERRAEDPALERRLGFVGGDFLAEPLPRGYDVISFVRVLHDWPAEVARGLLASAKEAMAPGARLVISEELRTKDRLAIQFFWTYFLIGVDACTSRLREVEWYTGALASLGFRDVRVREGSFDIIEARA
jgi:SAM-dependent methyltransferase